MNQVLALYLTLKAGLDAIASTETAIDLERLLRDRPLGETGTDTSISS